MIFNIEEVTKTMRNYEFSTQGTVRVVTFALISFRYEMTQYNSLSLKVSDSQPKSIIKLKSAAQKCYCSNFKTIIKYHW